MNGDGKLDLIVTTCCASNGDGQAAILPGNGDGTFQPAVAHDSGGQIAISVAVADLFLQRELDVVVANGCADQKACSGSGESGVGILPHGTGPAVTYRSGGSIVQSVKIADVNNDGIPDLLVAHLCANVNAASCSIQTPGSVGVLLGHDDIFTLVNTYHSGGFQTAALAVADVNGDGQPDLVVANSCASSSSCSSGSVAVLLSNGDGTFKKAVTYPAGFFPLAVTVADVNGDSKPDLVVANDNGGGSVGVLLGRGDGTFGSIVNYASGPSNSQTVAVADVNGDGKPDVITTTCCASNGDGEVVVLPGNGDGTFSPAVTFDSGGNRAFAVAIADVNGDGNADVMVTNADSGTVGVLLNNPGVKSPTSISLTSSLDPSFYGQKISLIATVATSGSNVPTGKVNFVSDYGSIGTVTLDAGGVATLSKRYLNAGMLSLTAVYKGDPSHLGSTSVALNQVIQQTASTASISSSPNPSIQGQTVTFTVKISSPTVTATGPVMFTSGKTVLGTAQLGGGKATFSTATLPVGSSEITVRYYGDSNIAGSVASLTQTVQ
jgi:hypothetical protein